MTAEREGHSQAGEVGRDEILAALAPFVAAYDEWRQTGSWGVSVPHLRLMRDLYERMRGREPVTYAALPWLGACGKCGSAKQALCPHCGRLQLVKRPEYAPDWEL